MDSKDKKQLSKADVCEMFITPAIRNAGIEKQRISTEPALLNINDYPQFLIQRRKLIAERINTFLEGIQ